MNTWAGRGLLIVALISALISLPSCTWKDELDKTRKEFASQLEETRKVILTVNRDVTNALPGGTYNLLIRDLNGDDPVAKKQAQQFLKSLGHFDIDIQTEVSVWFGFDATTPLKVDAFRAATYGRTEVDQRYQFKAGNLNAVGSKLTLPLADAEIRAAIEDAVNKFDTALTATQSESAAKCVESQCFGGWVSGLYPLGQFNRLFADDGKRPAKAAHDAARRALTDGLRNALLSQYAQKLTPLQPSDITVPCNVLDQLQFLFVAIRESDWKNHRRDASLKIRALIHEKDHPEKPYHKHFQSNSIFRSSTGMPQ